MANQWVTLLGDFLFPGASERRRVSVPPLDGPMLPNDLLQRCGELAGPPVTAPKGIASLPDGSLLVSTVDTVLRCPPGDLAQRQVYARLPGPAGPLHVDADGRALVCVDGVGVVEIPHGGDPHGTRAMSPIVATNCPTGVAVDGDGIVYVTEGSASRTAQEWVWDLMEKNRSGRLLAARPGGDPEVVRDGLAFPNGVTLSHDGDALLYTTAWDHSVWSMSLGDRTVRRLAGNQPGYPAHITRSSDGCYWLGFFAMRTHLVEFVLREDRYRKEMMRTIDPDYWIRPTLRSLNSGLEPLQGGGIKKLGRTKPWAPPRSYGLLVKLNPEGWPMMSMHSVAGQHRHGVLGAHERDGTVYIACAGADAVLEADSSILRSPRAAAAEQAGAAV